MIAEIEPKSAAGPRWIDDDAQQAGPKSFQRIMTSVHDINPMLWAERVVLYASVYGLQPKRCLEIGSFRGGSASIIVAALDDIGAGTLTCVDPNPRMTPETWAKIEHRATLITGPSPDVLPQAMAAAGGPFDWAFIDGGHEYEELVRDLEGTLPLLAAGAYVLFHDAHFERVERGLNDMFVKHPALVDLGMLATPRIEDCHNPGLFWGGIRAARYLPRTR